MAGFELTTSGQVIGARSLRIFRQIFRGDHIRAGGIVAFVSNDSFVDQIAFDGMRKYLAHEFDKIYVLDLGGNVRKNPKLSGTTHNVFGIQVGVAITLLIKTAARSFLRKSRK